MKLKDLREHYWTPNTGISWIPKKTFLSEEEIRNADLHPNKWRAYECSHCNAWHVGRVWKVDADDNRARSNAS